MERPDTTQMTQRQKQQNKSTDNEFDLSKFHWSQEVCAAMAKDQWK